MSWRVPQEEHERVSETGVSPSLDRVSGTLCLLHYETETSHLYSLRHFWRHFFLSSAAAHSDFLLFLRRVEIFLLTYLLTRTMLQTQLVLWVHVITHRDCLCFVLLAGRSTAEDAADERSNCRWCWLLDTLDLAAHLNQLFLQQAVVIAVVSWALNLSVPYVDSLLTHSADTATDSVLNIGYESFCMSMKVDNIILCSMFHWLYFI